MTGGNDVRLLLFFFFGDFGDGVSKGGARNISNMETMSRLPMLECPESGLNQYSPSPSEPCSRTEALTISRLLDARGEFFGDRVMVRVIVPVLEAVIAVFVKVDPGLNGFLLRKDARSDVSLSLSGRVLTPARGAECCLLGEKQTLGTDFFSDRDGEKFT